MFEELELPVYANATKQELVNILCTYLNEPKDHSLIDIYAKQKHHWKFPLNKFRVFAILLFGIILLYFFDVVEDEHIGHMRNELRCKNDMFRSYVGCRNRKLKKTYQYAHLVSKYISKLEGDCIHNQSITRKEFENRFPKINLSFFEKEKGFGIYVIDDVIKSTKPIISLNCRILKSMEERIQIYGFFFMAIFVFLSYLFIKKKQIKKNEQARELANQALKILSSLNKYAYAYDIKVQLRAKEPNIDSLWKYIIKYVEENQHVTVRVARTRNEVYWKWSV